MNWHWAGLTCDFCGRRENVALGTDGPGSNNDMDMKEVVRMATLLQKFYNNDAEALAGDLPLRMATANGACAMVQKNMKIVREYKA